MIVDPPLLTFQNMKYIRNTSRNHGRGILGIFGRARIKLVNATNFIKQTGEWLY